MVFFGLPGLARAVLNTAIISQIPDGIYPATSSNQYKPSVQGNTWSVSLYLWCSDDVDYSTPWPTIPEDQTCPDHHPHGSDDLAVLLPENIGWDNVPKGMSTLQAVPLVRQMISVALNPCDKPFQLTESDDGMAHIFTWSWDITSHCKFNIPLEIAMAEQRSTPTPYTFGFF